MDFHFYDGVVSLVRMREFLFEHMNFALPDGYETGDVASLFPRWAFWLHTLTENSWGPLTKLSLSKEDSNIWRITSMRRLDGFSISETAATPRVICSSAGNLKDLVKLRLPSPRAVRDQLSAQGNLE